MKGVYKGILAQTGYGWMRPDGTVFACPSYGHLAHLAADLYAPAGVMEWYKAINLLENQEQADKSVFSASLGRGNSSGWHKYNYNICSEVSHQHCCLMDFVYQSGWIRLGVMNRDNRRVIEAEGYRSVLERHRRKLETLADESESELLMTRSLTSTKEHRTVLVHEEVRTLSPAFYEKAMENSRLKGNPEKGVTEDSVEFVCYWKMERDSFEPHLMPIRASKLILHSIVAFSEKHGRFNNPVVSPSMLKRPTNSNSGLVHQSIQHLFEGYPFISITNFSCPPPPSIIDLAVADRSYWLSVPTREDLDDFLTNYGSSLP